MKKLAKYIKRVGLLANTEKISARRIVAAAAELIARTGRQVHCDAATAEFTGFKNNILPDAISLAAKVDLMLVFGGDGTILRVARDVAGLPTPILGINTGSLGFLTAVASKTMPESFARLWNGEFVLEKRALIEANGSGEGRPIDCTALNDIVVTRGVDSRLITLEVSVDDELLTHYRCDGLIVSSPTGSTAYSLSAGGAIIHPRAEVFELTPICPHTLSNQSVIVSLNSRIKVKVTNLKPETILSADGQRVSEMTQGDFVTVQCSGKCVNLVRLNGTSFFDTLRKKLHWSGANV